MGCKVLCSSVALLSYLLICQHVRAQCKEPSFESQNVALADHLLSFPDGSTVTFECEIGHRPVDSKAPKSVTCRGTQWTRLELSCTRKSCGGLKDIVNGRYEMTGNLFGDTAKPVCDRGYMLAGRETTRICRDQGWDGRDPQCEPVKCSAPPAIENGQLEDEPLDSYDYLQVVSYRCNRGLNLIGKSTLYCSEDGTFKPDPPTCFDGCPKPTISNAKRIDGKSPPYKLGNFVKYQCDHGYEMKGQDYIVCRENGWDPEEPKCVALPTTTTTTMTARTAATVVTSTTRPTSQILPKDKEETAPPPPPPPTNYEETPPPPTSKLIGPALGGTVGVGLLVGVGVAVVYFYNKYSSKHQYSNKMAASNQEECL